MWLPSSAICPSATTAIRSTCFMVESRCAISTTVRSTHQTFERAIDFLLGTRVEARGRFIQDQNVGRDERDARERHELPFACGEERAAFTHRRGETARFGSKALIRADLPSACTTSS